MESTRSEVAAAAVHELKATRFGGWYDGDNHKPGRGWYFVCSCGHIGLGQLLPESAKRDFEKHARRAGEESRRGDV